MTGVRRWMGAVWPAALLLVFLGTFRRTSDEASAGQSAINCDDVHARTMERLELCLELDPRHIEIMTAIGDLHAASGATDRAEEMYRRALAIDPYDGNVHLRLGELLLARGDAPAARVEAAAALQSQPGNPIADRLAERAAKGSRP